MSRWRRRLWLASVSLSGLGALTLVVGVGGWLWLRSEIGNRWLAAQVLEAAAGGGTEVHVQQFESDLWSHLRIEGLSLRTGDGSTVVSAEVLDAHFTPAGLLSRPMRVMRIEADGLVVDTRASDSTGPGFQGLGLDLLVDEIELRDSEIVYRNVEGAPVVRLQDSEAQLALSGEGPTLTLDIASLNTDLGLTGSAPAKFQGQVRVDAQGASLHETWLTLPDTRLGIDGLAGADLNLDLHVDRLAGADLDALLGGVGLQGMLQGTATIEGPSTTPRWTASLNAPEGTVEGSGTVDLLSESLGFTADLTLDAVPVDQLVTTLDDTVRLTGHVVLEGRGTQWPDEVELDIDWDGTEHDVYGQKLDGIQGQFQVRKGVVTLTDTALDGLVGELEITGDVDVIDGPLDLRLGGSVTPARLAELGITGIGRAGRIDGRLRGNPMDPTQPYRIDGTLRFRPFVYGQDVRFDSLAAPFEASVAGSDIRGTASIQAEAGIAYGVGLQSTTVEQVAFEITSDATEFEGDFLGQDIVIPETGYVADARGQWSYTNDEISATAELGPLNLLEFPGTHGMVDASISGDTTRFRVDLKDEARGLLQTTGTYNTALGKIHLDQLAVRPTPRTVWTAPGRTVFTLTEGGVADARIQLEGPLGDIRISGTVGTSGPLDGTVDIRDFSMDVLSELEPELPPMAGSVDLSLTLAGSGDRPSVTGTVNAERLWLEDTTRWLDLSGDFSATDGRANATLELGVAGEPLAHVTGQVPVVPDLAQFSLDPGGDLDLSLALVPGGLYRFKRVLPGAEALPEGVMSGVVSLTGRADDPDIRAAGIAEISVAGWSEPARMAWDWTRTRQTFLGWLDVREGATLRATARGVARSNLAALTRPLVRDGSLPEDFDYARLASGLVLEGEFVEFPMYSLASALGLDLDLDGDVEGRFAIRGDPVTPIAEADLHWKHGSLGNQELEDARIVVTPGDGVYTLETSGRFSEAGTLSLSGEIPLAVDLRTEPETWSTREMNLLLSGDGLPLRTLTALDSSLRNVSGLIRVKGGIRGTPFDPLPTVSLTMDDGAMRMPSLGLSLQSWSFDVQATRGEVIVKDFRVTTGPNRRRRLGTELQDLTDESTSLVTVTGTAKIQEGAIDEVSGQVSLSGGAWIMNTEEALLRADGDLSVEGLWPALEVRGALGLRDGKVLLDTAAFLDRAPLTPDPRLRIKRPAGALQSTADEDLWYDEIQARVKLDLKRNLDLNVSMPFVDDFGALGALVTRADLAGRIGGSTTLILRDGTPRMAGELSLLEGSLRLFRSRFTVQEGTIQFTGADVTDPLLNITGQMNLPQATISVKVDGPPSSPAITFDSQDIGDPSDIPMVLVTGQMPDLSSDGGANTGNALAGFLVGSVLSGQEFGNLTFEPDGTIKASVPLSQSLYAITTYNPDAREEENILATQVEWLMAPRVVLDTGFGGTFSWTDLYWEVRF